MQHPDTPSTCRQATLAASSRLPLVMFTVSALFLVLTAFALHHFDRTPENLNRGRIFAWLFALLWLPIFFEALIGYWRSANYTWQASAKLLLIWLIPPYRLALSTYPPGSCIWLPMLGWQVSDQRLFERLDRAFSVPMLFMAMMILPILGIELFWADYVQQSTDLALALDLGTAAIWLAFTIEFILMSAVAEAKLYYVAKHWINLAIILLPFLAFLRGMQVMRLLRMGKVAKALKVYRLRGLGLRAWQGIIALGLIERLLHRDPQSRLSHWQDQLREKQHEIEQLRQRIDKLAAELKSSKEK